ncbi:GTP-binding protein [Streptomyces sp. NPDC098781]|uniref:GTP-binding protein n=1 Tax=Streptomyces sp. NPDC098781 TaxID=3366097 RepID=UPI0037FCA8CA
MPRIRRPGGVSQGAESVLWRARRPVHPQRMADVLADVLFGVVRSCGHLWLAG